MKRYFLSTTSFFSLLAALAALVTAAGCGGGSSAGETSSKPAAPIVVKTGSLTKAQFVKRAETICKGSAERLGNGYQTYIKHNRVPPSGPGLKEKAADFVDTVAAPAFRRQIAELANLGAPRGDKEEVTAMLNAMQEDVEKSERQPLQFLRGGWSLQTAAKLARAYGLIVCSA